MGITFHEFKFLEYLTKNQKLGEVVTLGRLEVVMRPVDIEELGLKRYLNDNNFFADEIILKKFEAKKLITIDNSNFEKANLIIDLNEPLKDNINKYDTVIDFGTSEHVFNVGECIRNISKLCKINGNIIHSLPANNNCGHGFWQFSPELFFSIYCEENGYQNTEVFIFDLTDREFVWKVEKQNPGERIELNSDVPLYIACKTTKIKDKDPRVQQSDYVFRWEDKKNSKDKSEKKFLSKILKKIKVFIKDFILSRSVFKNKLIRYEGRKFSSEKNFSKSKYLKKTSIKQI